MKHIKLFEDFKNNNQSGDNITINDIKNCIKKKGIIFSDIILNFPKNDPEKPLIPMSVDEDGLITIKYDSDIYNVNLKDVNKIEY